MTWSIDWTKPATRDLADLDPKVKKRVFQTVEKYAVMGHGDVKKLKGTDEHRLRVGDWRVRFEILAERKQLKILRVLHRRQVYR